MHLVLALFAVFSVCLILRREIQNYDRPRKTSTWGGLDGPSFVLLVLDSNENLLIKAIRRLLRDVAGGVRRITLNRDYSSLRTKLIQREAAVEALKVAVTKLTIVAN